MQERGFYPLNARAGNLCYAIVEVTRSSRWEMHPAPAVTHVIEIADVRLPSRMICLANHEAAAAAARPVTLTRANARSSKAGSR
jgi:hypothetical protein